MALTSQFQPPSGHCHSSSRSASRAVLGSSAKPSRQQAANAFPSIDACRRGSPSITGPLRSSDSHDSTKPAAAAARGSPGGTPSSAIDTRRQ
ncbi:hypothetical protein [Nonomuraea rhizosphaerae]|uniref:hypothetical protein n=1 Tax=Nonomuraea rhizosphaerae TaxID=2665663 RepID=UPI001C5EB26F|nr:hypothetical protein [Nonomuraea rhizosphaerae]